MFLWLLLLISKHHWCITSHMHSNSLKWPASLLKFYNPVLLKSNKRSMFSSLWHTSTYTRLFNDLEMYWSTCHCLSLRYWYECYCITRWSKTLNIFSEYLFLPSMYIWYTGQHWHHHSGSCNFIFHNIFYNVTVNIFNQNVIIVSVL